MASYLFAKEYHMKEIEKEYEEKICVHCDYYKDKLWIGYNKLDKKDKDMLK